MSWAEPQGVTRVGETVLARLMESQIWHLPASSVALGCGGRLRGLRKGKWPLSTVQFSPGESYSSALAPMPDTSVSPCIPLMPFKLLPWCWSSEGVSLSQFMCRLFKRNCLGIQQFFPLTHSPLVLQPEVMGTYLPGTGTLGWRTWCEAGTPYS